MPVLLLAYCNVSCSMYSVKKHVQLTKFLFLCTLLVSTAGEAFQFRLD